MKTTISRILALFLNSRQRSCAALATTVLIGLGLLTQTGTVVAQTIESYTFTTNRALSDGNAAGLADVHTLNSSIANISSIKARLKLTGEFNGDVYAYLSHSNGFTVLLNRVGRTASNAAGYADSGFDVTFAADAVNGDIHLYQNTITPTAGQPLTGIWQPDGRSVDPAVVTDASSQANSLTNFVGLNAAGDWTLYLVDLESGGTNQLMEWGLDISGIATPTLTWSNPTGITYGTALSATKLDATVTYNGTNVPGSLAYSPAVGTVLNAGTNQMLTVTFTPSDTNAFQPVTSSVVIDVAPALLTISANSTNKIYGAALPGFTASYSGFVNGDESSDLDTPATLATTASSSSPVGNYAITANGASSTNYSFIYVNGNLTITQAWTTTALTSSATPAASGLNLTFTANLNAIAPGAGTPTGTVGFRVDGAIAGIQNLTAGMATFSISNLSHGSHTIVAEYAGDVNFVGSTNTLLGDQMINTTPVAGGDTIERYAAQSVKVRLTTLLANDSDADSDALNIAVSSTSVNGATISVSGDWVTYTPVAGFTNTDSFTYTITDDFGGSTEGTVTVAIKVDNDPGQTLAITGLGNGSVVIRGNGIPGRTYRLEYSDALAPSNWQALPNGSATANNTGTFEISDSGLTGNRYYRSVYP